MIAYGLGLDCSFTNGGYGSAVYPYRGYIDAEQRAETIKNDVPLLQCFLDGPRHVYKAVH